ncbi:hypothetical protein Tco_0771051 [Tanacetum coccineum]|uniref:Uncharacterized protein n=1 Tax=Tanacetum coccineum TaxID=301880 RepID=A0ABQ4ZEX8_9ASTR
MERMAHAKKYSFRPGMSKDVVMILGITMVAEYEEDCAIGSKNMNLKGLTFVTTTRDTPIEVGKRKRITMKVNQVTKNEYWIANAIWVISIDLTKFIHYQAIRNRIIKMELCWQGEVALFNRLRSRKLRGLDLRCEQETTKKSVIKERPKKAKDRQES